MNGTIAKPLRKADTSTLSAFHVALLHVVVEAGRGRRVPNLRLDGDTALAAYYLRHRESADLEFVTDRGTNPAEFGEAIRDAVARAGVGITPQGVANRGIAIYEVVDPRSPGSKIKLQFTIQSHPTLAPLESTDDGIRVGSYRDICAGKVHAACDRLAYRDFYDVHVILTRGEPDPPEDVILSRFKPLLADLLESDPGLNPVVVGQGLARLIGHAIVELIPLRLLIPATSEEIHRTLSICVSECARQATATAPPE